VLQRRERNCLLKNETSEDIRAGNGVPKVGLLWALE